MSKQAGQGARYLNLVKTLFSTYCIRAACRGVGKIYEAPIIIAYNTHTLSCIVQRCGIGDGLIKHKSDLIQDYEHAAKGGRASALSLGSSSLQLPTA